MTSVYGVTFIGARQQISNRLKDKGWTHENTIFRVSNYGARVRTCCVPSAENISLRLNCWVLHACMMTAADVVKPWDRRPPWDGRPPWDCI